MEDIQNDRYSDGNNDQNDLFRIREPTLRYCWKPMHNDNYFGIQQFINANNFELKPSLISMVQQQQLGNPSEDPKVHLTIFLELCRTTKMNRVDDDVIKLKLFSLFT